MRELECFLVLAEELHFGRTGERLYVSQSRVSQLLRSLESRIGARLVERTSRRVALTPLGSRFLAQLRPAYGLLGEAVDEARAAARCVAGRLRLGFLGSANHRMTAALGLFHARHPRVETDIVEITMADPFGPLRRDEVDAAVVLLPVEEPDLVVGPCFNEQPWMLAVSPHHPFAGRGSLDAEDLADCPLIAAAPPAPGYWRDHQAPPRTPRGRTVARGPAVATLQEGLANAAAGRGGMLLCRPTAEAHARADIAYVPVEGLPRSELALVTVRGTDTALLHAFTRTVADEAQPLTAAPSAKPPASRRETSTYSRITGVE
ncbi:LysR family transcriptional regulator [Streptomyces spirodelae]|uniref:LysR family transcriptional regulator n=1 Tax=Streptomyces spirodelae TaxID=2812904 RepID=A0ABS3WRU1_9ACTN|nr:LysR family transcriptional regulator [Streptomyces spirodelae]MBO8185822.1 LysR family transcriptional regulator [Streptomyces spirodelae]